ncbi:SagB/ThcOx family dehydrogenase [Candidatus Bipolaricaulota bacterium]
MNSILSGRDFLRSDRWAEWRDLDSDQKRGIAPPPPQKPYPADAQLVDLVAPDCLDVGRMSVFEAIRRRRSRREFTDAPFTLEEFSYLVWATQGVDPEAAEALREWYASKGLEDAARTVSTVRVVPSAGARNPFETYVLVYRVEGLSPGLYRYLPIEHKLLFLRAGNDLTEQVSDAFMAWVQHSAAVFVWTTIPCRMEWRYTIMTHKMIAQEAGHICQNLYLACESIAAGACAITHNQEKVDAILGVDGEDEFTIYVAPVGKVTSAPYHFDH